MVRDGSYEPENLKKMLFSEVVTDMSPTQKHAFVLRWERLRSKGMLIFILGTVSATVLMFAGIEWRSFDSFLAETQTGGTPNFFEYFAWWPALACGVSLGVLLWFGCEELYQHFEKDTVPVSDKKRFMDAWEAHRRRGRFLFILRTALIFSVALFATSVLFALFDYDFSEALARNSQPGQLFGKVIGGVLLGMLNWYLMEQQYRAFQKGQS